MDNISGSVDLGGDQLIKIKTGIYLYFEEYNFSDSLRSIYSDEFENQGVLGTGLYLIGPDFFNAKYIDNAFKFLTGKSIFFSFSAETEPNRAGKQSRILSLGIIITQDFLTYCSKEFPELLPGNLNILMGDIKLNYQRVSGVVDGLINQIFSCAFKGGSRKFFIEGKVMEILAHLMMQNQEKYSLDKKGLINPEEIVNVEKAADSMKSSRENFKNLEVIAKSVGMCRSRFHKCFKIVYGMSPFEYQRIFRMETAKTLINSGMNIAEVAYSVGYSSLSHFAKIFKEYERVTPSEFKNSLETKLIKNSVA